MAIDLTEIGGRLRSTLVRVHDRILDFCYPVVKSAADAVQKADHVTALKKAAGMAATSGLSAKSLLTDDQIMGYLAGIAAATIVGSFVYYVELMGRKRQHGAFDPNPTIDQPPSDSNPGAPSCPTT